VVVGLWTVPGVVVGGLADRLVTGAFEAAVCRPGGATGRAVVGGAPLVLG